MSKYPGFNDAQARALDAALRQLRAELSAELTAPDRVVDRRGGGVTRPRPGDVVRAEAGDVVVLPHPRSAKGRAPVVVLVESAPVDVLAESGTVNAVARVSVATTGAMEWYSTGTEWWGSAVGGSSGGGGVDLTSPGLSVLGRAEPTTGAMAAITATAARQVLRNNNAGEALEWEYPVGVGDASNAWLFDGIDDAVNGGDVLDFERTDSFTHSFWFRSTSSDTSDTFISNQVPDATTRGLVITHQTSGSTGIRWILCNDNNATANTLNLRTGTQYNDGALHHCIITYDGSSSPSGVTCYVDGSPVSLITLVSNLNATTVGAGSEFMVGRNAASTSLFAGTLRDVAVWDSELTAAHVAEVYNAGAPGVNLNALATTPAPNLWWRLDGSDATGTDGVEDGSGNGLHGTAEGGLGTGAGAEQAHSIHFADGLSQSVDAAGQATVDVAVSELVGGGLEDDGSNNLRRQALTGDVTASAGSNTTAIAAGVIVNADVNASAAIAQTKLGATTGFSVKASGASATTSAEPIITYSASSNMSAERVLTSSTSNTVSTSVANQVQVQRAALTGDVTSPANSNVTTWVGFTLDINGAPDATITSVTDLGVFDGTNTTAVGNGSGGFAINADLSSVTYTAGDGVDLSGNQFSADVSDFAGTSLENDGANNLRLALEGVQTSTATGTENNLSVAATTNLFVFTGSGDLTVNGATLFGGQPIIFRNDRSGTITFTDNSGSATGEVFRTPRLHPYTIGQRESVMCVQQGGANRLMGVAQFPGYPNRAGQTLAFNGVSWIAVDELVREEFLAGLTATRQWQYYWQPFGSGESDVGIGIAGRRGVLQLRVSASSGVGGLRMRMEGASVNQLRLQDVAWMRAIIRIADDGGGTHFTSASYGIGLATHDDASTGEYNGSIPNLGGDGIVFFKQAGVAAWRLRRESGGAGAVQSANTAVVDTWVELLVVNNGGSWDFYENGTLITAGLSGMPSSGDVCPVMWIDNDHGTLKDLHVDMFEVGLVDADARAP